MKNNSSKNASQYSGRNTNPEMDAKFMQAKLLMQAEKHDEALTTLLDIVQSTPDHAAAHNELGSLYYRKQDKCRALMHLERAAALDPNNRMALRNLADLYYVDKDRVEDAQRLYSRVLAINPDDFEVLRILANICVSQKQLHAAAAFFRKILSLMPENIDAKNSIAAIDAYQRNTETKTSPELLYKESMLLADTGIFDEAIILLQNLTAAHPGFALPHNDLGLLYANRGEHQKAHDCYRRAVTLEPGNMTFQKNLADLLLAALGSVDEAISIYSVILKQKPDDEETVRALAQAYAKQTLNKTSSTIHGAISEAPCGIIHEEAVRHASAGKTDEAIMLLEKIVAQSPDYAVAWNDLGVLNSNKGEVAKARDCYTHAVSLDPTNILFAKNLGGLHLSCSEIEEAALIYDRILEMSPDDIEALAAMGKISIESGQFETASFFFEKILEIDPQNQAAVQCLDALKSVNPENVAIPAGDAVIDNTLKPSPYSPPQGDASHEKTKQEEMLCLYHEARRILESAGNSCPRPRKTAGELNGMEEKIKPFVMQCKYGEALKHCMQALRGNENNPHFLLLLGNLYHRAGLTGEATFFIERAAQQAGKDETIRRHAELFRHAVSVIPNSRTDIENLYDPDVVLIQAPGWGVNTPPLGTAMLSSFARSRGYKVLPLDLNVEFYLKRPKEFENTWELDQSLCFWNTRESVDRLMAAFSKKMDDLMQLLLATKAKVIGFTVYSSAAQISLEIARRLKAARPELFIVFGGPYVSRFAAGPTVIKDPSVDAVAHGEGELTLVDILERVKNGRSLADCPGLLVRVDNNVINTGEREVIRDLDAIPAPDFTDYAFEHYRTPTRLPLSSSRGCVNQCIFCNERPFWKHYRHRSADKVFAEIRAQLERYPFINFLDFQDSLVNGKINELERLADLLIENNMHVQWAGQAVIRKEMTEALMRKLKQSGCVCMAYGLETPSASLMLKVGKVVSRGADVNAIAEAHGKTGLGVAYNFMFGLPGETEKDVWEAHEFLRRNQKYNIFVNPSPSFCGFAPGSFAYEKPDKYEIDLSRGGMYWKSKDGTNTYPIRLKRFEDFCCLAKELHISTTYPSAALLDRNRALGNYYFDGGELERARWYYEAWLAEHPDDVDIRGRLDRIRDRESQPLAGAQNAKTEENAMVISSPRPDGIICLNPFFEFEIDITGRVVVCCTGWFRHSLGNMKKQTIAEVWNSQVARYVRRKMYKGEWEDICNPWCPTIVHYKKYGTVIPYSELHKNKNMTPKLIEEILAGKDCLESTPTYFKLSDSKVCNLACKMCGVVHGQEFVDDKEMIKKRTKDIFQYLDRAKTILMCGNGDPFARPDTREILIDYKNTNPDLKFCLITNGLLLPKYWDQVKHQNIESIDISVDAACKETYEKIRTPGKWEQILKVLDLVKENKNHFGNVLISMVVMRSNFREIPAFIDMVESYGFSPMFSRIQGMFDDENIFEMRDEKALDELRTIVTTERKKKRSVPVIWQDLIEFAMEEEACLTNC